MNRCSVCTRRATKVCSKCTDIGPESYFCDSCQRSAKSIAHAKSHSTVNLRIPNVSTSVGTKYGNFKGEIWISSPYGTFTNVESVIQKLEDYLGSAMPNWSVKSSMDLQPIGMDNPDVIVIPVLMIGTRPDTPRIDPEFMERAKSLSTNIIYLLLQQGNEVSARTVMRMSDLGEKNEDAGFNLDTKRVPYNFKLVFNMGKMEVVPNVSVNESNVRDFESNLAMYVRPSTQPSRPQSNVIVHREPPRPVVVTMPPPRQSQAEAQELRVQIAEVTSEEATLRSEIARLKADVTMLRGQNGESASLRIENEKLLAEVERVTKKNQKLTESLKKARLVLNKAIDDL